MNPWILLGAMVWMLVLMIAAAVQVVRAPAAAPRILAFDTLSLLAVGYLVLGSFREGHPHYLDAALFLALLSFLATLGAARYRHSGGVF